KECKSLQLITGNGYDLHQIEDNSVDVAISFAALTSIPTEIIGNYLRELHRVLKPDGIVRLQAYLGAPQQIGSDDTLHLRCFKRENFVEALNASGFEVEFIKELVLPFEVSSKENGIEAVIVSLRQSDQDPR